MDSNEEIGSSTVAEALWTAALVKFISCFGSAIGRRHRLRPEKVFKGQSQQLVFYRAYDALRNKHVVHDENAFYSALAIASLGENDQPLDVTCLCFRCTPFSGHHGPILLSLVLTAISFVEQRIAELRARLLREVGSIDAVGRKGLESAVYCYCPTTKDLFKAREG